MTADTLISPCKSTTLAVFRRCLVAKDYSELPGDTEAEREEYWLQLYSEHCDLMGGAGFVYMIGQIRDVNTLASRISRLEMLINACKMCVDLAPELQDEGYTLDPDALPEVYMQQLGAIDARLSPERLRLNRMRADMEQGQQQAKEPTDEDFELTLIELSRFMKYEVNDTITVYKYCMMAKRLNDHIKAQMKGNAGSI